MILNLLEIFKKFIDIISPPKCIICSLFVNQNDLICQICWSKIIFIENPMCQKCGYPMKYQFNNEKLQICTNCISIENYFDEARSVCIYDEESVKSIIMGLKYGDKLNNVRIISNMIINKYRSVFTENSTILCVPMTKKSILARKFNQSALIALRISKILKLNYKPQILIKKKETKKQSTLNKEMRMINLLNSFKINKNIAKRINKNKNLDFIIIDDVFTTGATFNECSKIIKKEFPKAKITAISFARTVLS